MINHRDNPDPFDAVEEQAAAWVLRQDRGLTAREQDELSQWLAADAAHGRELARYRQLWRRLDHLGQWRPEHSADPNPDLLAPPLAVGIRRWRSVLFATAAAAAVWVVMFFPLQIDQPAPRPTNGEAVMEENVAQRVLPDGSIVELNRGATITVDYSADRRRVLFSKGEAHFTVVKDPDRPFIVTAQGVDVRAVGTAFNVRVDATVVEVLVTEGRVRLDSAIDPLARRALPNDLSVAPPLVPRLEARQRAIISDSSKAGAPQIDTLTIGEIERVLAWQHRRLDFTAAPLAEVVAEFNRRNHTQMILADPDLASTKVSASFRSDNIEGFIRLMETGLGLRAERREGEIFLHQSR